MSLIQAALNKTQNKTTDFAEVKKGSTPQVGNFHDLKTFDREVEKKILEVQKPGLARPAKTSKSWRLFVLFGLLCVTALIYWNQNRSHVEAVPPLTVSIERSTLTAKPELAQAVQQKVFAPVTSAPVARDLFYLTGIAWGGSQPYAVINGQILRAGDKLNQNVFIQTIEKEHVLLNSHGEPVRLAIQR